MKKVLVLTSRFPYPPIGGDKLRSFNMLKILSRKHDIYLVVITEENLNGEVENELLKYAKKLKIFTKRRYQFYLNALRFLVNKKPLQVNYYYFNDVQNYINSLHNTVDLAVPILIRTNEYLKDFRKPVYLDMVDSIGLNYKRSKQNVKSLLWKTIYNIETNRLLEYEKNCIKNSKNTFFVNKFEAEYWSKYGNTSWIPNGVNEILFSYNKTNNKYRNHIAFFGKMDYQPNIDAVLWFIKNVFDKLDKDLKFIIVGTRPSKKILRLEKKYENIEVTGFVEDPYEILKSALCIVAPMQTGGGIQNKILESMALGTINIVSSLAAKPIGARHFKHFLIADNPKEMANLINDIYKKPKEYNYLKENSRHYIKNNFTWKICEQKLNEIIEF